MWAQRTTNNNTDGKRVRLHKTDGGGAILKEVDDNDEIATVNDGGGNLLTKRAFAIVLLFLYVKTNGMASFGCQRLQPWNLEPYQRHLLMSLFVDWHILFHTR